MFDSYSSTPDVHVHNRIEVKNPSAADAARLHGEIREKAVAEIAAATVEHLGAGNEVVFLKCETMKDFMVGHTKCRLVFKINGQLYDLISDVNPYKIQENVYGAIIQEVMEQAIQKMIFTDKLNLGLGK
jgi:hypothetical protein